MDASKVWEWLARNERFGIVIAFAAICVFVGQYFNAWPFTLVQDGLGTLLVGGLLGLGLIIVATSRWVKAVSASGINSFQEWYERHTVMNRVDELTGPQKAALMWIALNPKESVSGSRFEEPFQALVEKKYLFAADPTGRKQGFTVNKWVYKRQSILAEKLPANIVKSLTGSGAPWRQRRPWGS